MKLYHPLPVTIFFARLLHEINPCFNCMMDLYLVVNASFFMNMRAYVSNISFLRNVLLFFLSFKKTILGSFPKIETLARPSSGLNLAASKWLLARERCPGARVVE